jgi:Uma2 family endonuclease
MSMPVLTDHRWSPSDLALLPDDGNRYECIDGALLVTPAPNRVHQLLVVGLITRFSAYCGSSARLQALLSPADIRLEPGSVVQPDVFVYYRPAGGLAGDWATIERLAVAVEILSPGSHRQDRITKRALYQRTAVDEYWIVDPDARCVERWRAGDGQPDVITTSLRWSPEGMGAPLEIDLPILFADAYGERYPSR